MRRNAASICRSRWATDEAIASPPLPTEGGCRFAPGKRSIPMRPGSALLPCRRATTTSMSFSAPSGGAGDFLLLGQEKVTKEKATPRTRPPHIPVLRIRSRPSGFAEGPSLDLRRTGALPVRHPSGISVVRSPCSRGPIGAHPARVTDTEKGGYLLRYGPGMAGRGSENRRRWRCREALPNGLRSAAIARHSNEQDVRSTIATDAMVFDYFLPKQKVARTPLR